MRVRAVLALSLACVAVGACGGGDDQTDGSAGSAPSTPDPTDAPANEPTDEPTDEPTETPNGAGTGTITVDIGTFDLVTTTCQLGAGGTSAVVIAATTPDGQYSFTAGGIAGAVTLGFQEVESLNIWAVAGGSPDIDGNSFSYDGPALKTSSEGSDPATTMSVQVEC